MKKLKIGTWNISECVSGTWNLNDGVDIDQSGSANKLRKSVDEIIKRINDETPDIVCFQEYPVTTGSELSLKELICENTDLKYCAQIDTYPSFLFSGGRVGVAVFSRYEISNYSISYFNKPNLTLQNKSGQIITPFEKGIITANFTIDELSFVIITGHAIAFTPFNARAEDYPQSYYPLFDEIQKASKLHIPILLVGDFNTENLLSILPQLDDYVSDKLKGATTPAGQMEGHDFPNGRKLDYFMTTNEIDVVDVKKVNNFSDHYFCVCTCILQ